MLVYEVKGPGRKILILSLSEQKKKQTQEKVKIRPKVQKTSSAIMKNLLFIFKTKFSLTLDNQ